MDTNKPNKTNDRVQKPKIITSRVGRWNGEMLKRLGNALKNNPEADMVALLTPSYSKKLQSLKDSLDEQYLQKHPAKLVPHSQDIRSRLSTTDSCTVIFQLSAEMNALLPEQLSLSEAIVDLLAESEVIYRSEWAAHIMVFKLNENVVVKITHEEAALTEHSSLVYLDEHLPSFPTPKPHGLVRLGQVYLLFTTFIPGQDLEKVWPGLSTSKKQSIANQLGGLFATLRSLPRPDTAPLGSVLGDGCKDLRRGVRKSTEPIMTDLEFQDFLFAGSKTASAPYITFMRGLMPKSPTQAVFTHGDVRPANIIVQEDENGEWKIKSIIDWEASGFYPEYWECIKATNNMTPRDNTDWYLYLPHPISPGSNSAHWLVDRIWDRSMAHS
ncbi:hypothetical protein F66182_7397 [Fusarium sp. NRRL 66182]|nr:hypothetical protein F66182_7397 [Fusarium sp. NRRL 66182]